jgi:hypothetical protein
MCNDCCVEGVVGRMEEWENGKWSWEGAKKKGEAIVALPPFPHLPLEYVAREFLCRLFTPWTSVMSTIATLLLSLLLYVGYHNARQQ